jgi:alcohol dehydrogenase class IV
MSTVLRGNWNYPTTIWAGPGRIAELPAACTQAGIKRPLIVTDEGLVDAPMIKSALAALPDSALFGAVRGNPASRHVEAALRAYRAGDHDGVVAFGGGRSWRCRRLPVLDRMSAEPVSSSMRKRTRKRSSSIRG